jgi:uncharacterized membrane protein YoaK (UPF0700 family)
MTERVPSARPPGRFTPRQRDRLAYALTAVAGSIDAIGYIVLFHVFTANMTGNTVALAIGIAQSDWSTAARRGFAIPMFLVGLLFSRFVVHVADRRKWRHAAALLFAVEAALLACFGIFGLLLFPGGHIERSSGALFYLMVALPSLAMGVQNASLSHFGPLSVRTTHVTGNLATLADQIALFAIWSVTAKKEKGANRETARSRSRQSLRETIFLTAIWVSYFIGASIGVLMLFAWSLASVVPPAGVLLVLVLLDLANPILGPREEFQQMSKGRSAH